MPKRRRSRRKRGGGFIAIPFNATLSLSTLNANLGLSTDLLGSQMAKDFFAISADVIWDRRAGVADEGPLQVVLVHNDLSDAEVVEALDAEVTDPSDIVARERSRRPVRRAGAFSGIGTDEVLNDGKAIRTTLKFSVNSGHQVAAVIINRSGANLTGNMTLVIAGVLYGRWQ